MLRHPDLLPQIIDSLHQADYLILPDAIENADVAALRADLQAAERANRLQPASVGRGGEQSLRPDIRGDLTCWLQSDNPVQARWLEAMDGLRQAINRSLFLGLEDYEAHYARYDVGQLYRRHLDSFRGNNPRQVSTVLYLNEKWSPSDGGQLRLFPENEVIEVNPLGGTLVVFLSERIPHEVLPARRPRYSIAGWFRLRDGIEALR